jgi:hypothetical protein
MSTSIPCPDDIHKAFSFLERDLGYAVVRNEELLHDNRPYAYLLEYLGNDRRVHLLHDYRDNFFDFRVIRGANTVFPNESDTENIITFLQIFRSGDPSVTPDKIQPQAMTCSEAAFENARLLRLHAHSILRGEEWL